MTTPFHSARVDVTLANHGFDWARFTVTQARMLALLLPPGRLLTVAEFERLAAAGRGSDDPELRMQRFRAMASRLRRAIGPGWRLESHSGWGYRLAAVSP